MPVAAAAPEQEVVFSQTETATDRRYVASNRFEIVPRSAAKFEARWATRKSRLAVLDGFRYFSLLRLTSAEGDGEMAKFNYVSFTIWSDKKVGEEEEEGGHEENSRWERGEESNQIYCRASIPGAPERRSRRPTVEV